MRSRARVAAVTLALIVVVLAAPSPAGAAHPAAGTNGPATVVAAAPRPDAPDDDGTGRGVDEPTTIEPVPSEEIIPKPDSGREPTEAGDRGGALQALIFVLIVAGVGGIVAMVVREARRNRAVATARAQSSGPKSSSQPS